ncbi:hypothetical protein K4K61_000753 [Colletotrichum sp. SAR11_59]|nr:hypothetical protein K4K61_000753 [Colletotrichum sp. SAR11_59]
MEDGAVVWDDTSTKGQTTEVKDGFEFWTDSSIRNDAKDDIFIAVGLVDPHDSEQVIPFDVFHPEASIKYTIVPRMQIVLTASHYAHGDHIDLEASAHVVVDFRECQVVHDSRN